MASDEFYPANADEETDQLCEQFTRLTEPLSDPNPKVRKKAWREVGAFVYYVRTATPYLELAGLFSKDLKPKRLEEFDEEVGDAANQALEEASRNDSPPATSDVSAVPPPHISGGQKASEPPAAELPTGAKPRKSAREPKQGAVVPGNLKRPVEERLGDWLWAPFRGPSQVVSIACPRGHVRDEEAVSALQRRLGWDSFGRTCFVRVAPGQFDPPVAAVDITAIALVGRLGQFGPAATRTWGLEGARFRFREPQRPDDLKGRELDPDYHLIEEDMGPRHEPIEYRTVEQDGRRTDYGIVQSYVVRCNGRDIRVVQCAGSSRLATKAVCYWAANRLFVPNSAGQYIPVPKSVKPGSRMEALIEVTAEISSSGLDWELGSLRLVELRFDRCVFNEDAFDWDRRTAKILTVLHNRSAGRDFVGKDVKDVEFDGEPSRMQKGHENFHLLVALSLLAHDNDGRVSIDELANDPWLWDPSTRAVHPNWDKYVRQRLWSLKKAHLGKALSIGDYECHLAAEVIFQPV